MILSPTSIFLYNHYSTVWCFKSIPNGVFAYNNFVNIVCEVNVVMYKRVRDLREDKDKTQKEIAMLLNMQLTVYQRYERGERELPLWAAIKLADYYNVTLDYLVGRSEK